MLHDCHYVMIHSNISSKSLFSDPMGSDNNTSYSGGRTQEHIFDPKAGCKFCLEHRKITMSHTQFPNVSLYSFYKIFHVKVSVMFFIPIDFCTKPKWSNMCFHFLPPDLLVLLILCIIALQLTNNWNINKKIDVHQRSIKIMLLYKEKTKLNQKVLSHHKIWENLYQQL